MAKSRDAHIDDSLVALTEAAAGRLAGVSTRRLRYWADTGLVRPGIQERLAPRTTVRLYGFQDLLELLVVAALLDQRFSLQQIRRVVAHLRRRGYEHPLAELRFATAGDEVYFQHPDGSWEGARKHDQHVLWQVLDLAVLRSRIREAASAKRPAATRGTVERRRKVLGSKPVFAGTRTPVSALFPYLERGYTTAKILEAFPHLSRKDVTAARTQLRESGAA